MKNNLLKISIAVLLLIPVKLFAQFTIYNTSNSGLLDNTIYRIYASGNNLWIGSTGGLNELTDSNWTSYTTLNSGLPGVPKDLMVYGSNLWVTTISNGVASFNGSTWNTYSPEDGTFPSYDPEGVCADSSGHIWFGSHGSDITSFNGSTWTNYADEDINNQDGIAYGMITDKNGTLWYGTHDYGLEEYNEGTFTQFNTLNSTIPCDAVYWLAYDKSAGLIWIASGTNGLIKYNGATFTTYSTINSSIGGDDVAFPVIAPNHDVWVGTTTGGISKFDGTNWTNYNTLNSNLPNDNVVGVAIDNSGNVWAGTQGGGLVELANYYEGIDVLANDKPSLNVYPNPTSSEINITATKIIDAVTVTNLLGQTILKSSIKDLGVTNFKFQLNDNGMYFVTITSNNQTATSKVIVSK